jgi:4-amino-4-deoxy-L-arabinose transferase-like glycosyltransferase
VVGALAASWKKRLRLPLDRRHRALLLWATWFVTAAAYFSIAGGQHRYYTVMLAPAVAALVGAGVVALWSDYRGSDREGWLLPMALAAVAVLHARILAGYGDWSLRLTLVIVGACLTAAAVLVVLRLRPKQKVGAYAAIATAAGMLAVLIAPTVWASYTVFEGPRGQMPLAGPPPRQTSAGGSAGVDIQGGAGGGDAPGDAQVPVGAGNPGGGAPGDAFGNAADPALVDYLLANRGDAEYLVAGTEARSIAPIILSRDEPMISLGGYSGLDPVFTTKRLTDLVNEGAVRFFLVPDRERLMQRMPGDASSQRSGQRGAPAGISRGGPGRFSQNESASWVQDNCERVPQERWQSSSDDDQGGGDPQRTRPQALYDCGTERR